MKPTDSDLPKALVETHNQLGNLVKNLPQRPAKPNVPQELQDRFNKQLAEFRRTLVEIDKLEGTASFA
jgi:hypothetical protein